MDALRVVTLAEGDRLRRWCRYPDYGRFVAESAHLQRSYVLIGMGEHLLDDLLVADCVNRLPVAQGWARRLQLPLARCGDILIGGHV